MPLIYSHQAGSDVRTVCIFDANHERASAIADALPRDVAKPWIVDGQQAFAERISSAHLVLAYDRKDVPQKLMYVIASQKLSVPLCAYSKERDLAKVVSTIKAGAVDYFWLPLDESFAERVLFALGERFIAPPHSEAPAEHKLEVEKLSRRQYEVAKYLSRGLPTDDVADALGISTRTAEKHIQNIYNKLGIHDRSELIKIRQVFRD